MIELCVYILLAVRFVLVELPRRVTALLACAWLGVVLWLHRKHGLGGPVTGSDAAVAILGRHGLTRTRVVAVRGGLVDRYEPREDAVVLSDRVFDGTNVGSLAIAAHEVGHALQAHRLLSPWWPTRLWAPLGGIGFALCFWLWLVGAMTQDQRWTLAALAAFAAYLVFLLLQIVCEIDASRHGVRELLRCDLISPAGARVARRILRTALLTYLLAFAASATVLAVFLAGVNWQAATERMRPILHVLTDRD